MANKHVQRCPQHQASGKRNSDLQAAASPTAMAGIRQDRAGRAWSPRGQWMERGVVALKTAGGCSKH